MVSYVVVNKVVTGSWVRAIISKYYHIKVLSYQSTKVQTLSAICHSQYCEHIHCSAVEPQNKGHFCGQHKFSCFLSFMERLSSSRRYFNYRESNFLNLEQCPL